MKKNGPQKCKLFVFGRRLDFSENYQNDKKITWDMDMGPGPKGKPYGSFYIDRYEKYTKNLDFLKNPDAPKQPPNTYLT